MREPTLGKTRKAASDMDTTPVLARTDDPVDRVIEKIQQLAARTTSLTCQCDVIMAVRFGLKSSTAMAAGLAEVPDRIARLDASFPKPLSHSWLRRLGFSGALCVHDRHRSATLQCSARGSKRPALARLIE
jgi:hypothetical protein